jgi:hypothetical protein
MAEWLKDIFSVSDIFFLIIWILLGCVAIGAIIFWIVQMSKYKHKIRIRVTASDRKFIVDDKFKVIKDDEGIVWWKLLKRKHLIPVAPADAIEISSRGSMVVEAYYTDEGEYIYTTDKINPKLFNDIHGAVYVTDKVDKKKYDDIFKNYQERLLDWNSMSFFKRIINFRSKPKKPPEPDDVGRYVYITDKNKSIESFQPFTTKQRLILVNQYKKAQTKKKMRWMEQLPSIISVVALVVILITVFIFWEDITRPSLQAMEKMDSITGKQLEITGMLQEIIQKKQILDEEAGVRRLSEAPS